MTLINMTWTRVPIHEVVAAFLQSERNRLQGLDDHPEVAAIIDRPDLTNPQHNHRRLRYLYCVRRWILGEIPPDTEWYEVQNLTDHELDELYVIARCGWDDPSDRNELRKVAARKPDTLETQPAEWPRLILWGHSKAGAFTIIEGNHRLVAYASTHPMPGLSIATLIGLSSTPSYHHIFDPGDVIAFDLWAQPSIPP